MRVLVNKIFPVILAAVVASLSAKAQNSMRLYKTYSDVAWAIPIHMDGDTYVDFDTDRTCLRAHYTNKDGEEIVVSHDIGDIDSIGFALEMTDEEKGHDKYRCFTMHIDTQDQQAISSKETWVNCHIAIDGMGQYSDYDGTARIRGRGNSTWLWYDKKPYRFKLDSKSKLLGLDKAKDWNLLANYRDVTDIMNTLAFETARYMGLPHTNHTRYVEVFLNGEYIGLYQLTEKIEVDENRVDIDEENGWLLSLDLDDGPGLSPNSGDNFWSEVFSLPVSVKHPDDPTADQLDEIKADFAILEAAVKRADYATACELMDMDSFIKILQLHEYLYNVEIDAPRSLYLWKDVDGKYTFGPVWDWDAGYDFDWSDMYTSHTFFTSYTELIYGTAPRAATDANYTINGFFRYLFQSKSFVDQYKSTWNELKDSVYTTPWNESHLYTTNLSDGPYRRDLARWPISGKTSSGELNKMRLWLRNRLSYLNGIIANYPDGTDD